MESDSDRKLLLIAENCTPEREKIHKTNLDDVGKFFVFIPHP